MTKLPLVSIVVLVGADPAANAATSASVRAQDYPEIEVIELDASAGESAALNAALPDLRGSFVTFVSAGNRLAPQFVATHIQVHLASVTNVARTASTVAEAGPEGRLLTGHNQLFTDAIAFTSSGLASPDRRPRVPGISPAAYSSLARATGVLAPTQPLPAQMRAASVYRRSILPVIVGNSLPASAAPVSAVLDPFAHALGGTGLIDQPLSSYSLSGELESMTHVAAPQHESGEQLHANLILLLSGAGRFLHRLHLRFWQVFDQLAGQLLEPRAYPLEDRPLLRALAEAWPDIAAAFPEASLREFRLQETRDELKRRIAVKRSYVPDMGQELLTVCAYAEDLAEDPALLRGWADAFNGSDPVLLLVITESLSEEQQIECLRDAMRRASLDDSDDEANLLVVMDRVTVATAPALVAESRFVYGNRRERAALGDHTPIDPARLGFLRFVLDSLSIPSTSPSARISSHPRALRPENEEGTGPWRNGGLGMGSAVILSADVPIFLTGIAYNEHLGIARAFGLRHGDTPAAFILHSTWWLGSRERITAVSEAALAHRAAYPHHLLKFACPTAEERDRLSAAGLDAIVMNHSAFVSEHVFRPLADRSVEFDAIYNAHFRPWKRHGLAFQVGAVAYLSSNDPASSETEREQDRARLAAILRECPNHVLINPLDSGLPVTLEPEQMNAALNRAAVGLCLSAEDGPGVETVEYLLAGLPVVTTPSVGGRDSYLNPDFCITCDPDPVAVRLAVERLRSRAIPAEQVRESTLAKLQPVRDRFLELIDELSNQLGSRRPDHSAGAWPFGNILATELAADYDEILDELDGLRQPTVVSE